MSDARAEARGTAIAMMERAYAPYSRYRVGAAVVAEGGRVTGGCNVENASYGLTVCAERNAVFSAVGRGDAKFTHLALATDGPGRPCGACLQVLAEFGDDLTIELVDTAKPDAIRECRLSDLLPDRFSLRKP